MQRMTDPQVTAIDAILRRKYEGSETDTLVRYRDTKTVMTLLAMAKPTRGWVRLNHGIVDGRRQVVSADVTSFGMKVYLARCAEIAETEYLSEVVGRVSGSADQTSDRMLVAA